MPTLGKDMADVDAAEDSGKGFTAVGGVLVAQEDSRIDARLIVSRCLAFN
jgi:hypothetical protein